MGLISDIELLRYLREPSYSKRIAEIILLLRDRNDQEKLQPAELAELQKLVGLTPKGKPMPQTVEEWKYLYGLAETKMLEAKEKIRLLRIENNTLQQKVESLRRRTRSTTQDTDSEFHF